MRNVDSLTDFLVRTEYRNREIDQLADPDAANLSRSLMDYRLETMADAALCYTPNLVKDPQYQIPDFDIEQMTSVGVAMAMLIISTMQNEVMLDTQLEGVKGTQNQKLSASNTTIMKIKQQIRKSRFKSPFQKFMEWLNGTAVMKFLTSKYGKIVMFLIGAIATVASFGTAGPAIIAISSVLLAFQAAELILGKSMGELLTQSMDDGAAKQAVQMAIDMGLMIADMAVGSAAASKATKAVDVADAAGDVADKVQKAQSSLKQLKEAADNKALEVIDKANEVIDNSKNATQAAKTLENVADSTEDAVKAAEKIKDQAQKGMNELKEGFEKIQQMTNDFQNQTKKFAEFASSSTDGVAIQKAAKELNSKAEELFSEMQKFQDKAEELFGEMQKFQDEIGDVSKNLGDLGKLEKVDFGELQESMQQFQKSINLLPTDPRYMDSFNEEMNEKNLDIDDRKELTKNLDAIDTGGNQNLAQAVRKNASDKLGASRQNLQNELDDIQDTFHELIANRDYVSRNLEEYSENLDNIQNSIRRLEDSGIGGVSDIQKQFDKAQESVKELKNLQQKLEPGQGLDDVIGTQIGNKMEKQFDKLSESLKKASDKLDNLGDRVDSIKTLQKNLDDGTISIFEAQQKARSLNLDDDVIGAFDVRKVAKSRGESVDMATRLNRTATGASRVGSKSLSGAYSALRLVGGFGGLEHLNFMQQMMIATQRLQMRFEAVMQVYQSLYALAISEEERRNVQYAAEVEAIRTKSDALQELYQMFIDNQMADIQALMSYVKSLFERTMTLIREKGETEQMIASNLSNS